MSTLIADDFAALARRLREIEAERAAAQPKPPEVQTWYGVYIGEKNGGLVWTEAEVRSVTAAWRRLRDEE
jgi:hypothetical protein